MLVICKLPLLTEGNEKNLRLPVDTLTFSCRKFFSKDNPVGWRRVCCDLCWDNQRVLTWQCRLDNFHIQPTWTGSQFHVGRQHLHQLSWTGSLHTCTLFLAVFPVTFQKPDFLNWLVCLGKLDNPCFFSEWFMTAVTEAVAIFALVNRRIQERLETNRTLKGVF